jgi:hypothetical protein
LTGTGEINMTTPTAEEIRALMQRHIEYWNEGRLEDWLALCRRPSIWKIRWGPLIGRVART